MKSSEQRRPDSILSAAFPIVIVFLFAIFTGLPEFISILGAIRPIFFIGGLGLIAVFVTGRFMRVISTPIGKTLTVFTAWFIICIPLAIWRGGSFGVFQDRWSKSYLAYVLTAGLISTALECKKAFRTIGYGAGLLAILALAYHTYTTDGRLSMRGGRYSNANDLAWTLLVGLIFLAYTFMQSRGTRKVVVVALIVPVLLALSKTGSRTLLIGTCMLFLYAFLHAKAATRGKLIVAVPLLLIALVIVTPQQLRQRYTTLFNRTQNSEAQVEASGSSEERLQLLKDSLSITLAHPFFGVGPGNFQVAQVDLSHARGEAFGLWHVTHNSYTELSSEMGLPGVIIYIVFLVQCWRTLSSVIRKKYLSKDVRVMAQTLQAALLVMATVAFFESFAYEPGIPIVAGLITALSFVARDERPRQSSRKLEQEAPPAALPEPEYEPAWSGRMY